MQTEELVKYITGNCSLEESEKTRAWINEDVGNKKEFVRLKNSYALSGESVLRSDLKSEYNLLLRKLRLVNDRNPQIWQVLKYAAVIVFSVITTYLIVSRKNGEPVNLPVVYNEVIVPKGQISEYIFNDGTHVWLNSDSKLRFPLDPDATDREVFLEGEAYFEVTKNKERVFIVHTGAVDVKVLGTSFNVQSYPDMDKIETTLVEGIVEIQNKNNVNLAKLEEGEQLCFSKSRMSGTILNVDTAPYKAWRNGKLVFRDKSLGEIACSLERWYNVKIEFNDEKIKTYRFTGTILKNKPFDQILQAIRLTAPIRYEIRVLPESSNEIVLYLK